MTVKIEMKIRRLVLTNAVQECMEKCTVLSTVKPVTLAERSKTCTAFARSEDGIVGSNLTQGMDV
jgi:hypothetical protein